MIPSTLGCLWANDPADEGSTLRLCNPCPAEAELSVFLGKRWHPDSELMLQSKCQAKAFAPESAPTESPELYKS